MMWRMEIGLCASSSRTFSRVLVEGGGAVGRGDRRLVDLGVEAEGLGGLRLLVAGEDLVAGVGVGVELRRSRRRPSREAAKASVWKISASSGLIPIEENWRA